VTYLSDMHAVPFDAMNQSTISSPARFEALNGSPLAVPSMGRRDDVLGENDAGPMGGVRRCGRI
jgi:hypothetical protein